jgi:uncharacterized protein YndB with AHSA1/START domain
MSDYGRLTGPGAVRLERLLPGPIERVWAYLTESEKRAKWLAGGPMELKVGGNVRLEFRHSDLSGEKTYPERFKRLESGHTIIGRVTRCEPPRLLAYTWGEGEASEVTFELSPRGSQVLLVLTHRRLATRKDIVSVSGGWHAHVGILEDALAEREPRPFWTTFLQVEAQYEARTPQDAQGSRHATAAAEQPVVVRVGRRFEASPERVFDAWLDPGRARRFLFATSTGQMVRAEIDARVGGSFNFTDRRDNVDVEHIGTYLEIDRPRRLVFTFHTERGSRDLSRVTIEIAPQGEGCELTLTHEMDPKWGEYKERTLAGWSKIVEGLATVL